MDQTPDDVPATASPKLTLRWDEVTDLIDPRALSRDANVYRATVDDGELVAIVSQEAKANLRSLTVSFRTGVLTATGERSQRRFPTWAEIESAAESILPRLVDPEPPYLVEPDSPPARHLHLHAEEPPTS